MDDLEYMPIDDDPYCLDDEPRITQIEKIEKEEASVVNINFERVEHEIGKNIKLYFS